MNGARLLLRRRWRHTRNQQNCILVACRGINQLLKCLNSVDIWFLAEGGLDQKWVGTCTSKIREIRKGKKFSWRRRGNTALNANSTKKFARLLLRDVTWQVMWVDIEFFHMCDLMSMGANCSEPLDLSAFPKLESIRKNVEENERLKDYLKQRPELAF